MVSQASKILILALLLLSPGLAELRVVDEPQDYLAQRLEGTWLLDEGISDALSSRKEPRLIRFQKDPEALNKILKKHHPSLEEHKIAAAGFAYAPGEGEEMSQAVFLLVDIDGDPLLLFFYDSPTESMGEAESAFIHLITGSRPEKDLFFLGTEYEDSAFLGFRRKSE